MKEPGIDPSLVDVLERFGLVTPEQADANLDLWKADIDAYQALVDESDRTWEELPRRARLFKTKFWWTMKWRREHSDNNQLIRAAVRRDS